MLGYDFEIIYKKGKQNVVTNELFGKDEDVEALLYVISIIQPDWIAEAMDEWKNDEKYGHLFKSSSRIMLPLIHLGGKKNCYGKRITYILVRVPNSSNMYFLNSTPHQ